jgi:hypothetical protein
MNTKQVGPFLGVNNRLPDFSLHVRDKGDWLRDAVNVDITDAGNVVRRAATTLVQAMSNADSLYLTSATAGYLRRGAAIYAITLPTYTETLLKILSADAALSWVEFNGSLYYSNGTDSGRIEGGVAYPWGLTTPTAPTCAGIAGTLYAGTYQVAVSYYNNVTGEEGGISASSNPALATAGGIRITPPGASAGATHVNVYLSTVNGSIPMWIGSYAIGGGVIDISAEPARLRESNGRFEAPLPAGTQIFMANGRLCSVSQDRYRINLGSPARPGYYIPIDGRQRAEGAPLDYGYITFPAPIDLVIPTQMGVYVAYGDVTQFFAGTDFASTEIVRDVLPYGAVPGTAFVVPHKENPLVGWFGAHGIVLGDPQGVVKDTMIDNIDLTPPASGTSVVIQANGYKRVVSCGWCLNMENNAATRYEDWSVTSSSLGYATMPNGLYRLDGSGKVDAYVSLGKKDFGSENLKYLPACYIGVSSDTPMKLVVTTPEAEEYEYEARSSSTDLRIQRVDPGRGLRANWYNLSLYNTEGSEFTLASVSFAPIASGRRI